MLPKNKITQKREGHLFIPHLISISNNWGYTAWNRRMTTVAYDVDESITGLK